MTSQNTPVKIAIEPANWRQATLLEAVRESGAQVSTSKEANALIWVDEACGALKEHLHDGIDWVQLPWAGIESFTTALDDKRQWTCGKGIYAGPVAEHVLAMTLALLHNLHQYALKKSWSGPVGRNLNGARVLILGGGGITEKLLPLLAASGADSVVIRRKAEPMNGARCATMDALHEELSNADVVVLALALTEETTGLISATELGLMKNDAFLINVARGAHIVTDDLVNALKQGQIAAAALDVTDPEPLPDGHALWDLDNCLITPHVANTPEMGIALLKAHVATNVRRYIAGEALLGPVDVRAGY